MKQNADAISNTAASGGMKLYQACRQSPYFADLSKVRLHLSRPLGRAILHSHVVDRPGGKGLEIRKREFHGAGGTGRSLQKTVVPAITSGKVKHFNQFHLSDDMEQKDPTCKPILGYSRSLLYLVSQSLERGEKTPILGLESISTTRLHQRICQTFLLGCTRQGIEEHDPWRIRRRPDHDDKRDRADQGEHGLRERMVRQPRRH